MDDIDGTDRHTGTGGKKLGERDDEGFCSSMDAQEVCVINDKGWTRLFSSARLALSIRRQ